MAPKKPTPPQADSSSSDDEENVSEEVSEDSSSEEQPKNPKPDSSSSSEEEDGSDSGTDEEVTPVKPVEVQSLKVSAKSKQKQPATATAPASKKRPVESKAVEKESKKLKKVEDKRAAEEEEEEVKKVGEDTQKQLFQRLFTEEDEIEMLKALLHYSAAKKSIEGKDFYDFVKKSIHVDVTRAQLADKIRRLKKKYENHASKTKEGVDKTFGKPHDQLCYDLSKNIWGKSASVQIPPVVHENSSSFFCLSELAKTKDVVGMGLSDDLLKKGFEFLSDEARAALEEKWKNMATAELELYYNRLELSGEQVKLSLDALKASGHRG